MDIKLEESARILLKFIQNTKPFNDLKDISESEHINSPLYEYIKIVNEVGHEHESLNTKVVISYIPLLFSIYPIVLTTYSGNCLAIADYFKNVVFMDISNEKVINKDFHIEKYTRMIKDVGNFIQITKEVGNIRYIINSVSHGLNDVIELYDY